jgi:hypothetical protein
VGSNPTPPATWIKCDPNLPENHRRSYAACGSPGVSFMKKAIRIFIVAATALVAPLLATASPYSYANAYERIATSCCPCPPGASDQQCFLQCNALLPRCHAPTVRYVVPPSSAPRTTTVQACTTALTGFCCARAGDITVGRPRDLSVRGQLAMSIHGHGQPPTNIWAKPAGRPAGLPIAALIASAPCQQDCFRPETDFLPRDSPCASQ